MKNLRKILSIMLILLFLIPSTTVLCRAGGGGGRQLRAAANGRWLAHLSGHWPEYHHGTGRNGVGG